MLLKISNFCRYLVYVLLVYLFASAVQADRHAGASTLPFIAADQLVTIPAITTVNNQVWEAQLQCDKAVQLCIVVQARQICQFGITQFSPLNPICLEAKK